MEAYSIRLPDFEGPLDLLLQMIEHRELDITRVSLADVADQYLEFITRPGAIEITQLAEYLVIAAKLILAKSRLLLPNQEGVDEVSVEDSAEALARQLREYKLFKQSALMLRGREEQGLKSFPRRTVPPRPAVARSARVEGLSFQVLYDALRRTIDLNPPLPSGTLLEPLTTSIHHRIERIRELTLRSPRVRFSALLADARTRVEVVVVFLAVLESIKRKLITAQQDEPFGEIFLLRRESGAPLASLADEDETEFSGA